LADGLSFTSYGVKVGLRVNDAAILDQVVARLPPGAKPSAARVVDQLYSLTGFTSGAKGKVRRFNLGYWNLVRFARSRNFEDMLNQFESHVQLTVAEYAPRGYLCMPEWSRGKVLRYSSRFELQRQDNSGL
jgi:hypothetical protein